MRHLDKQNKSGTTRYRALKELRKKQRTDNAAIPASIGKAEAGAECLAIAKTLQNIAVEFEGGHSDLVQYPGYTVEHLRGRLDRTLRDLAETVNRIRDLHKKVGRLKR